MRQLASLARAARLRSAARPLLAMALLVVALAPPLAAQEAVPTPVDTLARVRVTQRFGAPRRVTGWLLAADTQSVTVGSGRTREAVTVPLAELERLDVSRGQRSRGESVRRGAKRGLAGGLVASALLVGVATLAGGGDCADCFISATGLAVVAAVPITVATTAGGALLGAADPGDRWVQVRTPVQLRPSRAELAAGAASP